MNTPIRIQLVLSTIPSLVVGGFAIALLAIFTMATPAYAETYTASPISNAGQYSIEALTDAYETATDRAAEASARAAESEKKITALETKVETQQERTDTAVRDMYVMEQEKLNLFDAMLNASSFDDLVKYADYIERASKANTAQLNEMKDLLSQLEAAHVELEQARQEAVAQEALAREALLVLQDQRATKP